MCEIANWFCSFIVGEWGCLDLEEIEVFVPLHEGRELSTVVEVLGVGAKYLEWKNGHGGCG